MSGSTISSPADKPVPKASVALGLFHSVLRGEWDPGRRLVEMELAERFKVSRTPVREALLELEGLGVVELRRNCGAVLRPFGPREVGEIYEVRTILEVEAARLAAGKISAAELAPLQEGFAELSEGHRVDREWELDRDLHRTIAEASGNRRLAGEIGRYGNLVQAVREAVGEQSEEIYAITLREHLEILDRLIEGSAVGAAAAMRDHLGQAAASAVAAVAAMRGC